MYGHTKLKRSDLVVAGTVIAATVVTAIAGSVCGDFDSSWYRSLRKPVWQPSGRVIGAVWTVLYTLTALSGILVGVGHKRSQAPAKPVAVLFGLQFGLNAAFTPLFTRLHALALAMVDSGLLCVTVAAMFALAWRVRRLAALLLVPYVLWTAFATFLSWRLWRLNRPADPEGALARQ